MDPLPAEVTAPCEPVEKAKADREDGGLSLTGAYLLLARIRPSAEECVRRQAQLVALIKWQDQVRAKYQQTLLDQSKPWWKFW